MRGEQDRRIAWSPRRKPDHCALEQRRREEIRQPTLQGDQRESIEIASIHFRKLTNERKDRNVGQRQPLSSRRDAST